MLLGFSNALWLLFLSRLIDGLSGANISTAQAVITDSTNEKTRTQGLGLLGAAFGIGFVVGPIIAFVSLTAGGENYHVPAFLAAGFSALSILLTWFWLEETLPAEKRGKNSHKAEISISSMLQGLRRPLVGFLLVLMFAQQIAFGGFEQLLSLFTLNRLGLNASGNAVIFVFVGILVVAVQGGLIGMWSRKYGDKWLIYTGLATLSIGLILTAFTPAQPVPWYSRQAITAEFSTAQQASSGGQRTPAGHQTPATQNIQIALPDDTHRGWLGLAWILVAMIPAAIGGGMLQPAVNSMLTRSVPSDEVGGTRSVGVSAAFLSGANVWAPVLGGALFQALGSTAPFAAGGVLLAVLWVIARRVVK